MPSTEEVNALVERIGEGDRDAFVRLFNHFAPRIVTYLMRGGTPAAVAEELAQEAMILVWRKSKTFTASRGAATTWIFAIARNLRIDRYRHEGGQHRGVDQELDDQHEIIDPGARPEEHLDARQREIRVHAALQQLSAHQMHLLHLSFLAGSPHSDIARDLRMPLGTVKAQIRRALLNMRRHIEASGA